MPFFEISLETANKFYAWGWRASIAGAVITAVGVILLMYGTRVRDRATESQLSRANADLRHAEQTISRQNVEIQTLKPRQLSPEEAAKMTAIARQLCPRINKIPVTAADSNQEAQAYALSFVQIFKAAGCTSDLLLPIPGLTPDVQSVRVGVRSLASIPEEVPMVEQILSAGGIPYYVNPVTPEFFPDEPFVLIIGAKPT
jgi:hypothetical protein